MNLISFELKGRFAHFLRAEASVSALSYPFPPRTVILGILGAILGLPKDKPQVNLEPANIAISGKFPKTHWHKTKMRQTLPAPMPLVIKKTQKGTSKEQKLPKRIFQEWLFNPEYTIYVSIPEPYNTQLEKRLLQRQWYFQPSLGISEMIADLNYLYTDKCTLLPKDFYNIQSVFPQNSADLNMEEVLKQELVIHSIQMPRSVTPDRIFSHSFYIAEREAKAIPVNTNQAYKFNDKVLMFL